MPIDANQWRASVGLLNASRMPRSLVAMKGTRHLRKHPTQPKSRGARVLTAVLSACVVLLQALWSVVVHVGRLARNLPDVNWWMAQFGCMQRLFQASKKHAYQAKNKFPSLLDFGSTTLLKVVTVARNAGSRVWKMTDMMNHWKSHTCVSMFGSQPKGVKGLSLLLTSLIVVQMLLIMAGDVELNPGPPKKQGIAAVELKELVTLPISNWRAVGLQLGLPDHTLDRIQADERHQPQHTIHCIGSMFSHWLRDSEEPSYPQVAEALVAAGETAAAEQLCSKVGIPTPHLKGWLPSCLGQYAEFLKEKYKSLPIFPGGDWPPSVGNRYIKLALIEHKEKLPRKESTQSFSEDSLRGKVDRIVARKSEIKVLKVFEPVRAENGEELPLKVLIDGAPGVGKTTLCRKVVQEWARQETLANYHLVVLLQLRRKEVVSAKDVGDLFPYPDPSVRKEVVTNIVQSLGKGVLILLDAFDELTYEHRRDSIFYDLICGELLPKCSVVVTSRPYASECLQTLPCIQRHVEVLGFSYYEMQNCIMHSIYNEQNAKDLVRVLQERQDIALLCSIPLNCAILTYVYERENYKLPDTLTELFSLFIKNALKRHAQHSHAGRGQPMSLNRLPPPMQTAFDNLCSIAFNGLVRNQLVFTQEELEPILSMESEQPTEFQLLGLMTATKCFTSEGEQISYQFLHLTIQEFLAARWVVTKLPPDDQVRLFIQKISDDHFRIAAIFIAGMSKLQHPKYKDNFSQPLVLPTQVQTDLDQQTVQWFLFQTYLLYESCNPDLCEALASAFAEKNISLSGTRLTLLNCMTLCHFLLRSSCRWNLSLGNCRLNDESIEMLKTVCSKCSVQSGGVRTLRIFTNLKDVAKYDSFTPTAILLIPEIPLFKDCSSIFLDCSSVYWTKGSIPPHSDQILSTFLTINTLTHLEIVDFHPTQPGVFSSLAMALMCNTTLRSLNIRYSSITNEDATFIFEALQHNKCIQDLDMSYNKHRRFAQAAALVSALEKALLANNHLETLNLSHCGLDDECARGISAGLKENSSLKSLDISHNKITSEGAVCILEAKNEHLKKLDISGCNVEQNKLRPFLLHFLTKNTLPALQELRISDNLRCRLTDPHDLRPSDKLVLYSSPDKFQCLFEFARGVHNPPYPSLHHIKHLDLSRCPLWIVECMCGILRDLLLQSTVLETLDLSYCGLNNECARHISVGLKDNSSLKSLDISANTITSEGTICIFEALQHNTFLQDLTCTIGHVIGQHQLDDGGVGLAIWNMLSLNKHLKSLHLQYGRKFDLQCIASGLASNSVLESLILSTSWNPFFSLQIIEALKKNSNLKKFDLQDDTSVYINDRTAAALADMLASNQSLVEVNLRGWLMDRKHLPVLQSGLRQNFSLRTLGIRRSPLMQQDQVQQMVDEINEMRAAKRVHPLNVKLV